MAPDDRPKRLRDDRITAGALDLLRAEGPRAVTVEGVATRAGVAKTTIYRRYRDRDEVLAAALASLAQPAPPKDRTALAPVVEWVVGQCRAIIEDGIGAGGVSALLTEDDPVFTALMRSLLVDHRRALSEVMQELHDAGQIRADLDVETFLDFIVGAYLAERARSGTVSPSWSQRVLRSLWPVLAQADQ
jgi:AcrR family transcriptional regulator